MFLFIGRMLTADIRSKAIETELQAMLRKGERQLMAELNKEYAELCERMA